MSNHKRIGIGIVCGLITSVGLSASPALPAFAQAMGASALTFSSPALSVAPGGTASVKITATLTSGTTWGTTLQAIDLPKGLSASFDPSSGDPTFVSTMKVDAASSMAPGTYVVKIQATGDDPSSATAYKIVVTKGS